jgi:NADH dehydrogenase (ubiquinone) Fe-S protein 1
MLRVPLARAIAHSQSSRTGVLVASTRLQSNAPAKQPEKIEVFIDDQPVMVLPGTTVLQVSI